MITTVRDVTSTETEMRTETIGDHTEKEVLSSPSMLMKRNQDLLRRVRSLRRSEGLLDFLLDLAHRL